MSSSDFKAFSDVPDINPEWLVDLILQSPSESHVNLLSGKYSIIKISKKSQDEANYYIFAYGSDLDVLGKGTSNRVVKGWKLGSDDEGNRKYIPVAVNIVDGSKVFLEQMQIAEKINKLFYPETEPIVSHPQTREIFLITKRLPNVPLVENGMLASSVTRLPITKKLELMTNILILIKTMHDKGYIHGDLTGRNILLESEEKEVTPNLIDFNNAKYIGKGGRASLGTPGHIAPEGLRGVFSEATDIFSIAPELMMILGATNPYSEKLAARKDASSIDEQNEAEIKKNFNMLGIDKAFAEMKMSPKANEYFLDTLKSFLSSMVNPEPSLRPAVDQCIRFFVGMQNILEHYHPPEKTSRLPFFAKKESAVQLLEKLQKENMPSLKLKK